MTRAPDQALGSLQLLSNKVTSCDQIPANQKRGKKAITTMLLADHMENGSAGKEKAELSWLASPTPWNTATPTHVHTVCDSFPTNGPGFVLDFPGFSIISPPPGQTGGLVALFRDAEAEPSTCDRDPVGQKPT